MSDNIVALRPNVNFRGTDTPINEFAATEPVVAAPAGSDVKADGNSHAVTVLPDADFKVRLEALAREIEQIDRNAIFRIALRLAAAHELFRYR